MRSLLMAVALALALTAPAQAQDDPTARAEELAREGAERLMRALEALVQSIPQYEAPIVNEDGDIIIRRKRPRPDDAKPPTEDDEAET